MTNPYSPPANPDEPVQQDSRTKSSPNSKNVSKALEAGVSFLVLWGMLIIVVMVVIGKSNSPWVGIPLHLFLPILSLAIVIAFYRRR
jgi:hypothetical protein